MSKWYFTASIFFAVAAISFSLAACAQLTTTHVKPHHIETAKFMCKDKGGWIEIIVQNQNLRVRCKDNHYEDMMQHHDENIPNDNDQVNP